MKILYKISLLFSLILAATSCSDEKFFEETRWDETTNLVKTPIYILTLKEATDSFEEMWVYHKIDQAVVFEEATAEGNVGIMTSFDKLTNFVDKTTYETLGDGTEAKLFDFSFDTKRVDGVSSYSFKESADDIGTLTVVTAGRTSVYKNVLITEDVKNYDPTFSAK